MCVHSVNLPPQYHNTSHTLRDSFNADLCPVCVLSTSNSTIIWQQVSDWAQGSGFKMLNNKKCNKTLKWKREENGA